MRHDLVAVALIDVVRTEISGNRCRSRPITENLRTCILHTQYHFCTGCPIVDNLCQGFTVQMDIFTSSPAPPPLALRRKLLRPMRCARVGVVVVRAPLLAGCRRAKATSVIVTRIMMAAMGPMTMPSTMSIIMPAISPTWRRKLSG